MPSRRIRPFQIPRRFVMPSVLSLLCMALLMVHDLWARGTPTQDHASLGISLAKQGKLPEAEQELREAVRVTPVVALHRAQLGSILGLEGKWKEEIGRASCRERWR